ncbi:MAG: PorP/SprF family type IX secretion system membrane protein [Bacteroidota bacterium]
MRQFYVLGICCLYGLLSYGQDPSFSQFYANRTYLNPALTGLEEGISVSGIYRMQWRNIDQGFETYAVTAEVLEPFIRSGFGLTFWRDTEGIMALQTTYVGLSYAYAIPLGDHEIRAGLQARWVQRAVDWDRILFSDQLDPVFGPIFPTSLDPGLDQTRYTDFDFGFVWRSNTDLKIGKKLFRDTRSNVGFSISHAPYLFRSTGGNESLQGLNTRTAPRLTLHAGSILPTFVLNGGRKNISLSPNIKYDRQGTNLTKGRQTLQVVTCGLYVLYEGIYLGGFYQNKYPGPGIKNTNALILMMGAYVDGQKQKGNRFFIGFSYDTNTSGVGTASGGVYELAFRWSFQDAPNLFGRRRRSSAKRSLDCRSFF